MFKRSVKVMALTVLVAVASLTAAQAVPMLMLDDGVNSVTITDEMLGDAVLGTPGSVGFIGALGAGPWIINITAGVTKPALGSATNPRMDTVSLNLSGGVGMLTIKFTETGFGPSSGGFFAGIGGTTNGTVTASAFGDTTDAAFGMNTPIAALGPFGPGAFSGDTIGSAVPGSSFSLTQVIKITHTGAGQVTSLDFELSTVPEPGSMLLLGSGLASCGYLFRRRRENADEDAEKV